MTGDLDSILTGEFGAWHYFFYVLTTLIYVGGLYLIFRNKSDKKKQRVVIILAFSNLALHFLKLLFQPYWGELPISVRNLTAENICAVTVMLMPFVYLERKQNIMHDYMFFAGVAGGLAAFVCMTAKEGAFEVLRFYYCHLTLLAAPVLAALFGLWRPRVKYLWAIPLMFFMHLCLILLNELILMSVGLVENDVAVLLDRDFRNASLIFGPPSSMEDHAKFITALVPKLFQSDIFGTGIEPFYWPVIWMAIPVFVYIPLFYTAISAPFDPSFRQKVKGCVLGKKRQNENA